MDKVRKDIGHIDILINNAGVVSGKFVKYCHRSTCIENIYRDKNTIGKPFLEIPDKMIERTMNVNIMAHFWV